MRSDLSWKYYDEDLSDSDIKAVEEELGVKFPNDYIECIKKYHGGAPEKDCFTFDSVKYGEMGSCLGVLLRLDQKKEENILDTMKNLNDQLPKKIIPFGDDGGGDFMCFDYRDIKEEQSPKVVYWHHELNTEESISYLAQSFTEFIKMLS